MTKEGKSDIKKMCARCKRQGMLVHCFLYFCFKQNNRNDSDNENNIPKFGAITNEKKGNSDKHAFECGIISCYHLEYASIFPVLFNQDRQQQDGLPSIPSTDADSSRRQQPIRI